MSYLEKIVSYEFTKSVIISPMSGAYRVVWEIFESPHTIPRECIRTTMEEAFEYLWQSMGLSSND